MAKRKFKTEVNQLLDLLIHSLYSHPEIFLRELISNASDAMDKLKYLTLTDDNFKSLSFEPRVDIELDKKDNAFLTISDNGIGMNEEDLNDSLGTIARSGTKNFLSNLSGDAQKDSNLIGQFGVGFYSVFMVADKVDVITRKAGEEKAFKWSSDGKTDYTISDAERESQGTTVRLHLNETGKEQANRWNLEQTIKKYSNHIAFPIFLHFEQSRWEGEGDDRKEIKEDKIEQINSASALWKRSKSEISEEEYNEFFKSLGGDNDEPLMKIHTHAEGTMEYTTLFFIPQKAPFDMYQADYKSGVKLYVKRVFITDDDKELLPVYLRFMRGVIDSEDLPLNVSRELLQKNKVLTSIKNSSVKKILSELENLAKNNSEKYIEFINEYNRPLKEGLYSDFANKENLMKLVRYKSTTEEGWVSLSEYVERMSDDQKAIYYITGGEEAVLRNSPLLEAYNKKNIEVLIMDDEIDELVLPMMGQFEEKEFKAVNKSGSLEDLETEEDKKKAKNLKPVLEIIKKHLGERVKDVVASARLYDSPSCVVADENDPTAQLQQMMKAMGQTMGMDEIKPILEVNPDHDIVKKLGEIKDDELQQDISWLLFEQALMVGGVPLKDPNSFAARLNRVVNKAI